MNFADSLSFHLAPSSGENLNLSNTLIYLSDSLFFFTKSLSELLVWTISLVKRHWGKNIKGSNTNNINDINSEESV